jgi:hypothetical protein
MDKHTKRKHTIMTLQFYYNGVRVKDGHVTHPLEKLQYTLGDLAKRQANPEIPSGSVRMETIPKGYNNTAFGKEIKDAFTDGIDCLAKTSVGWIKPTPSIVVFPTHPLYEAVKAAAIKSYTRDGREIPA